MMATALRDALEAVGATVFERGWLSANNILIRGNGPTALVDSGYCTHARQTLMLVEHALGSSPLELLLNTHLHSDHCGGNAALRQRYPDLKTLIPPGDSTAVSQWNEEQLTYLATGQECPRFGYDGILHPGEQIRLGSHSWDIHGAKGHDPHSIVLFQPEHQVLISADALWQNGFGVVFPELEGVSAFDEVRETLNLIEQLAPLTVIPGHGSPFQELGPALERARSRLNLFQSNPDKHRRHALKVLIKFRLLDLQQISLPDLQRWTRSTAYVSAAMPVDTQGDEHWLQALLTELEQSGALYIHDNVIFNR